MEILKEAITIAEANWRGLLRTGTQLQFLHVVDGRYEPECGVVTIGCIEGNRFFVKGLGQGAYCPSRCCQGFVYFADKGKINIIKESAQTEIAAQTKSIHVDKLSMSLIEKAKSMLRSEPQKSYVNAGICDANGNLTTEGNQLFIAHLFEMNSAVDSDFHKLAKSLIDEDQK